MTDYRVHQLVIFTCHRRATSFEALLHEDDCLTHLDRSQLPSCDTALLAAACHAAELTEDCVAEQGLHMHYCGFRSAMRAIADRDRPDPRQPLLQIDVR